ncbi:MAG TPA: TetR/AcrR family transcriptional regulator [Solirubrobacterales bacterium]|nr:TetR/AcrR family transcriptional regulator [Solirubrobacterales bacterium]
MDPPRGALAATQRERVLAAAEQAVAEKGCAGATIEGIVKLAGVSTVTFYEHFADKEECFVAAFDRAVEETREQLREAAPARLAWPDQVREGLRALLAAIDDDPARARMCLVEAQMGGPALVARYDVALDDVVAKLREGRALGSARGWLPDSLEQATVGGLAWLLRQQLELGGGEASGGVGELYPRMIEIALSPYMGGSAAMGEAPAAITEPVAADG